MSAARAVCVAVLLAFLLPGCSATYPERPHLLAGPTRELLDAPVSVRVVGLTAGQRVELTAATDSPDGSRWGATATFRADARGTVNLATQAPVSGDYTGAHALGLIDSLHPAGTPGPGTGPVPFPILGPGFRVQLTARVAGRRVARTTLERLGPTRLVTGQPLTVRQDGLAGAFYRPNHPGRYPGVVVLGGSEGGTPAGLAAMLAAHGLASLALAYFGEPGLPACLCAIPLGSIHRALEWLAAQPTVQPDSLGLVGVSRGSQAALLVAATWPALLHRVVAVSPIDRAGFAYPMSTGSTPAWTLHGQPVLGTEPLPVAGIHAPLLLITGAEDTVWDSADGTRQLRAAARPGQPVQTLWYPHAGHALAGLIPGRPGSTIPGYVQLFGGTPGGNARADRTAWPALLRFLAAAPAN